MKTQTTGENTLAQLRAEFPELTENYIVWQMKRHIKYSHLKECLESKYYATHLEIEKQFGWQIVITNDQINDLVSIINADYHTIDKFIKQEFNYEMGFTETPKLVEVLKTIWKNKF